MNRLKDIFKKLQSTSTDTIVVEKRHVSWFIAGILCACLLTFVSGYFWGKRAAIEQFCQHVEGESFADQIYAAMSLNIENEGESEKNTEEQDEAAITEAPEQDNDIDDVEVAKKTSPVSGVLASSASQNSHWYAQLIGFKTRQEASIFCARLAKRDIPVIIKEHVSTTARGKKITWFQVVTEMFDSKAKLEKLTDALAYEEKIHGIRIIEC